MRVYLQNVEWIIMVKIVEQKEGLIQSWHISKDSAFTMLDLKHMLYERFETIDYAQAKEDVEPFIRDSAMLNIWSADFFKQIT